MKKLVILFALFITFAIASIGFLTTVNAAGDEDTSEKPSETIDLECYRLKIFNPNVDCETGADSCAGLSATDKADLKASCESSDGSFDSTTCACDKLSPIEKILPRTNFDGSIDDVAELIRLAFSAFFMLIAIVAVFLGIYGMYKYTTAGEDQEKVQLAQKIFKNALMGIGIAVGGIIIVNIIFIFMGLDPSDLYTFNISNP